MAKKKQSIDIQQLLSKEQILDVNISDELSSAILKYAIEVITDRALPNVEDGLKPVQRRILWTCWLHKYLSNTPFVKCAKIVGDVMGETHPHGLRAPTMR